MRNNNIILGESDKEKEQEMERPKKIERNEIGRYGRGVKKHIREKKKSLKNNKKKFIEL